MSDIFVSLYLCIRIAPMQVHTFIYAWMFVVIGQVISPEDVHKQD